MRRVRVLYPLAEETNDAELARPGMAAVVCWAKLLGFTGTPVLAHAEIATFRNLVLHVAARITRGARQVRVRIDESRRHAKAIAAGWLMIRAAFT